MGEERASTGTPGLDEVLFGGLVPARSYLLSGPPGTGKTTIGWHFLTAATQAGQPALLISFGEAENDLRANAASSGFSVDAVDVLDLSPSSELFSRGQSCDIFSASEVEREPLTATIMETVERVAPKRIFIDSVSSLRYLSSDAHEFRRQLLSMLRFFVARGAVVLMSSETSPGHPDDDLRFLADGVLELALEGRRRTLRVLKFRGSDFRVGHHTLRLQADGAVIYPRLVPSGHRGEYDVGELISSGIPPLDELLHGGLERGTVTLLTGPTGVGKTTLGMQFVKAAAARGDRSSVYVFDERVQTLVRRCESVNIPIAAMIAQGALRVVEVEALSLSPDEFANMVRRDIEEFGTRMVMIDSVSGYRMAVTGNDLSERLHEMCRYLENIGVTALLVNELQDVLEFRITDAGISYLADNVIYLRYLERYRGGGSEIVKAIGVLKKRLSGFENAVREFAITDRGLVIGDPLAGVLAPVINSDRPHATR